MGTNRDSGPGAIRGGGTIRPS